MKPDKSLTSELNEHATSTVGGLGWHSDRRRTDKLANVAVLRSRKEQPTSHMQSACLNSSNVVAATRAAMFVSDRCSFDSWGMCLEYRRARLDPGRRAEDEGWTSAHVPSRSSRNSRVACMIGLKWLHSHLRPHAGGDLCHDGNQRRDHAWASDCACNLQRQKLPEVKFGERKAEAPGDEGFGRAAATSSAAKTGFSFRFEQPLESVSLGVTDGRWQCFI